MGESDEASSFLRLLIGREERDPGSVAEIYADLEEVVEFVASHQDYFEADPAAYGDFPELAATLQTLVREGR